MSKHAALTLHNNVTNNVIVTDGLHSVLCDKAVINHYSIMV